MLGQPYADVYPGNLVSGCTLPDGTPAVIKTEPERPDDEDEFLTGLDALVLYAGEGMVRVLETDRDDRVVLMELVEPGQTLWEAPIDAALAALASVMRRLRRPSPVGAFPDVRAYGRAWPKHLRLYGGPGPIDADLFDSARGHFVDLCDSSGDRVVLHGDLHYGNVLRSARQGWLAIDPKGIAGDPCYEVGALFRNRVDELYRESDPVSAMRRRVDAVAALTGFDRERVRLWAFAQAVLSEIWSVDDPSRPPHVDLRAARLLDELGLRQ